MDSQVSRMDNRWTLHIEDFGKIRTADITVAPLTLFVGDNNSGKSYLMTLLYTLLHLQIGELDLCEELPQYQECEDWLLSSIKEADSHIDWRIPICGEALHLFETLLNTVLERNKVEICRKAFERDVVIGKISISFPLDLGRMLVITPKEEFSFASDSGWSFALLDRTGNRFLPDAYIETRSEEPSPDGLRFLTSYILECLLKWGLSSDISHHHDVVFLPISRTGFMLTYVPLAGESLKAANSGYYQERKIAVGARLTKPYSDFLRAILTIDKSKMENRNQDIVCFIERTMVHGFISVSGEYSVPEFSYLPAGSEDEYSMALSSGVVTELAPLLLFLRHTPVQTLFIEEPEISLHPALQQAMARVLVRLSNQGTPVFATTHNNTIIQHINNMIRLSHISGETRDTVLKKIHFDHSDLIDEESITMCQFDVDGEDRTTVHELSGDEYGFVVPTFVDALTKMLDQSRAARQDLK